MDENTTTEAPATTGVEETQPVEQAEQAAAVDTQDAPIEEQETSTEPDEQEADNIASDEDDNSKWLASKGIDPTDPQAMAKIAKMAREAERNMHQKTQRASELEKSISSQVDDTQVRQQGRDPDVVRLVVKDTVRDFYDQHPDARSYEQQMVKELDNRPYLVNDLEALYAVVKSKTDSSDSLRSDGGRQALETLASKQRAAAPSGAAVNSQVQTASKITRAEINRRMQAGDMNWLDKNDSEINRLAANGLLQ